MGETWRKKLSQLYQLTYSSTMSRPLTFLAPHIGHKALNPLQLGDAAVARQASQSSAEALVSPVP